MNDMNILTVNGEQYNVADAFARYKISNDLASVIKETLTGTTVSTDMVSPLEHEVECRVESKNLVSGFRYPPATGGSLDSNIIDAIPGENFTVSCNAIPLAYFILDPDNSYKPFASNSGSQTFTFKIPNSVHRFSAQAYWEGTRPSGATKLQVEHGITATPYTPYIPDLSAVRVSRYGKNLNNPTVNKYPMFIKVDYDNVQYNVESSTAVFPCEQNKKYRISYYGESSIFRICFLKDDLPTVDKPSVSAYNTLELSGTSKENIYATGEGARFLCVQFSDADYSNAIKTLSVLENGMDFTPSPSGIVTGMKSISPSMTILTDNPGAIITAEYNVDTRKFIESNIGSGSAFTYDGAGYHNSVYRGKNLGSAVTPEQYAAIKDGTFKDLYIGDYWTINGVNWRIAAFDYFLNTGDTPCTEHHAVIVPDTALYNGAMNGSNTTTGAYLGSKMYKSGLEKAKNDIKSAFPDHILKHRIYLNNTTSYEGKPTGGVWVDNEVSLMTEQMVYGSAILTALNLGTSAVPLLYRIEKIQLPLFAMNPMISSNGQIFWLRDIVNDAAFACVTTTGTCDAASASKNYLGVRPYFCVYGGG